MTAIFLTNQHSPRSTHYFNMTVRSKLGIMNSAPTQIFIARVEGFIKALFILMYLHWNWSKLFSDSLSVCFTSIVLSFSLNKYMYRNSLFISEPHLPSGCVGSGWGRLNKVFKVPWNNFRKNVYHNIEEQSFTDMLSLLVISLVVNVHK